ncbi:hypothetical protein Bhyg_10868, partial [Pseudolycoriella hygida]
MVEFNAWACENVVHDFIPKTYGFFIKFRKATTRENKRRILDEKLFNRSLFGKITSTKRTKLEW